MNVNMAGTKQRSKKEGEAMIMTKRDKVDTNNTKTTARRNEEYEMIQSLRKSVNEGRER